MGADFDDDDPDARRANQRLSSSEFDDPDEEDARDATPDRGLNWGFHFALAGAVTALMALLIALPIGQAKSRLNKKPEKKEAPAVAAPSDLGFCTEGFKQVLRRVLDSCGLLTANQRRGCTPGNVKQVAAISDKDFSALFMPLADRAGILQFESGAEDLTPEALSLLEKKWIDSRGASIFLVVARASPEGSTDHNQALSHKRSNSVLFHIQKKFNDPELEQKVGLLWLGEEYAQLPSDFCRWERSKAGECTIADINRSAFVSWIDCQL